ncbi:hypothetical protein [Psychromonas sp. MME2]|uniref:hypothetical protein n=1 Tax=unclassified Psychromonas TaxID=2614957 RepID=UPI00339C0B2C
MARPITFTSNDIIKAANELNKSSANKITGTALRKIIGTGRPEVIMRHYNKLLEAGTITATSTTTEVTEVVEVRDLPKEVEQSLNEAMTALKSVVMHCNDIAHNTVENRLSAAIDKAKSAEVLAAEDVEKSEIDLAAAYDEIEQLKDERMTETDQLNEKITTLIKENSDLKIELNSLKKSYEDTQTVKMDLLEKLEIKTEQYTHAEQEFLVQKTRSEEVDKQLLTAHKINAEHSKKIEDATALHTSNTANIAKLTTQLTDAIKAKVDAKQEVKSQTEIANSALLGAAKSHAETVSAKEQITALKDSEAMLHKQLEQLIAKHAVEVEQAKVQINVLENNIKTEQAKKI